jgi:hypothetical protein
MKSPPVSTLAIILSLCAGHSGVRAQVPVGSAFTYQGQLKVGGIPADGDYDFRFQLYDAPNGGSPVGGNDLVLSGVPVGNGLFTVELDFGPGIFTQDARWMEVGVRHSGQNPFTTLSPRQPVNAAPYALYALDVASGAGGYWAADGDDIHSTNPGRVGVGTSAPATRLEVRAGAAGDGLRVTAIDPAGPTLDLKGFAPVGMGGLLGIINFLNYDETLMGGIEYTYFETITPFPLRQDQMTFKVGEAEQMRLHVQNGSGGMSLEGSLWVKSGTDASLAGGGYLTLGSAGGNLALDNNEIMARDDGEASTLYLNNDGGYICLAGNSQYGRVGIGTTSPDHRLEVHGNGSTGDPAVRIANDYGGGLSVETNSDSTPGVYIHNEGSDYGLKVYSTDYTAAQFLSIGGTALSANSIGTADPAVIITHSGTGKALMVSGSAEVDVLYIAGSDVAEKFPASEQAKPGMVMAIDPKNPGKLCLARGTYNRCVAGVVSGANGFPAGAVLGNVPSEEDAPAVALSGRVWVHCDATKQPIAPGDLLTTAASPGYAMKATDHRKAQGAVLGKAMTALEKGRGLVLVLVSLQ